MRKTLRKSLTVAAVAASAIGLTAVPASAGPPWTVSGAPTNGTITGRSTNTFLQLVRGGTVVDTLRCNESIIPVNNVVNGPNDGTTPIGSIPGPSTVWNGCRDDNFGLTFTVAGVGTWNLFVNQDGPPGDVVGTVRNVTANINGPFCTATFTSRTTAGGPGSVPGQWTNSSHTLTMNPTAGPANTLRVSAASCAGIIQVGDVARFNGTYTTTPATVVITP
jgi:hypothetical protein